MIEVSIYARCVMGGQVPHPAGKAGIAFAVTIFGAPGGHDFAAVDDRAIGRYVYAKETGGHGAFYTPTGEAYPPSWHEFQIREHASRDGVAQIVRECELIAASWQEPPMP